MQIINYNHYKKIKEGKTNKFHQLSKDLCQGKAIVSGYSIEDTEGFEKKLFHINGFCEDREGKKITCRHITALYTGLLFSEGEEDNDNQRSAEINRISTNALIHLGKFSTENRADQQMSVDEQTLLESLLNNDVDKKKILKQYKESLPFKIGEDNCLPFAEFHEQICHIIETMGDGPKKERIIVNTFNHAMKIQLSLKEEILKIRYLDPNFGIDIENKKFQDYVIVTSVDYFKKSKDILKQFERMSLLPYASLSTIGRLRRYGNIKTTKQLKLSENYYEKLNIRELCHLIKDQIFDSSNLEFILESIISQLGDEKNRKDLSKALQTFFLYRDFELKDPSSFLKIILKNEIEGSINSPEIDCIFVKFILKSPLLSHDEKVEFFLYLKNYEKFITPLKQNGGQFIINFWEEILSPEKTISLLTDSQLSLRLKWNLKGNISLKSLQAELTTLIERVMNSKLTDQEKHSLLNFKNEKGDSILFSSMDRVGEKCFETYVETLLNSEFIPLPWKIKLFLSKNLQDQSIINELYKDKNKYQHLLSLWEPLFEKAFDAVYRPGLLGGRLGRLKKEGQKVNWELVEKLAQEKLGSATAKAFQQIKDWGS